MSQSLVLDCSVSVPWFLRLEKTSDSEYLLRVILSKEFEMIVPDLWWYEAMNVVKSAIIRSKIIQDDAQLIFQFLRKIPKKVIEIGVSGQFGILKLAIDENLSVYDATYLFVAISTGSKLVTCDKDLLCLKDKYSFIINISELPRL